VASAQAPRPAASVDERDSFHGWRRTRPFWGGLFLILAGLELFLSANLDLGDMSVKVGPQGFLAYVIPVMMLLCGVLTWLTPANRLFLGIIGLLTATYSVIGLNLGGFVVGLLLGVLGGALVIAWAPRRTVRTAPRAADTDPEATPADPLSTDPSPGALTTVDTSLAETTGELPLFGDDEPPRMSGGGAHRPLFVISLITTTLAAVGLALGDHTAALAAPCPVPQSARPTNGPATAAKPAKVKPVTAAPTRTATTSAPSTSAAPSASAARAKAPPGTGAAATPTAGTADNPIADAWHDIVDGVGRVLGGGPLLPASPETTAQPSTEPTRDPTPGPGATPSRGTQPPVGTKPPVATQTPAGPRPGRTSVGPSTSPDLEDVPCLGPRVFKTATAAADLPLVSLRAGTVTGASLTMYNSIYDGVVEMRTVTGTVKALQFSMDRSVTERFQLRIDEPGGGRTVITSSQLTTTGHVTFYTPRFTGKLFGIFPVTFTPDAPPPLTLPVLPFTDVVIDLALVRCDTLQATSMRVTGA
jgi:hypothetical protein